MSEYKKRISNFKEQFISYCLEKGVLRDNLFSKKNFKEYVDTAVDGFNGYQLYEDVFNQKYDVKTFTNILLIDFKSRLNETLGIATDKYESTMLIEAPQTKKTSFKSYITTVNLFNAHMLFNKYSVYLMDFEKYSINKRKHLMDERTWYLYCFTTKREYQNQGFGKKIMEIFTSFAKKYNYRICLETNDVRNVGLYEHFGFSLDDESNYNENVQHFVMLFDPDKLKD